MNWDDYQAIGQALGAVYPTANYMTLSDDDLVKLVVGLPSFVADAPHPDKDTLSAVRYAWVAAVEGDDDTGPYDGAA